MRNLIAKIRSQLLKLDPQKAITKMLLLIIGINLSFIVFRNSAMMKDWFIIVGQKIEGQSLSDRIVKFANLKIQKCLQFNSSPEVIGQMADSVVIVFAQKLLFVTEVNFQMHCQLKVKVELRA